MTDEWTYHVQCRLSHLTHRGVRQYDEWQDLLPEKRIFAQMHNGWYSTWLAANAALGKFEARVRKYLEDTVPPQGRQWEFRVSKRKFEEYEEVFQNVYVKGSARALRAREYGVQRQAKLRAEYEAFLRRKSKRLAA